jgi:pimeloyl-ACP methyl ester carboxylesterase
MMFKEFGDKSQPSILLLHGGGLSWWSWKRQIEALQKDYRIITPVIDGHGDDYCTDFASIEDSAGHVVQYIRENLNGHVFAICGLSLGAQITVEILSQENDITEHAVIESALVCPIKTVVKLSLPMFSLFYGFIKKRWFAKLQANSMKLPEDMFTDYYEDSMRMTKESLIQMTKSNGYYTMPATLKNTKAKTLILTGEKELSVMIKSAKCLYDTISGSSLLVMKKIGHGEISLTYPDRYVELLKRFLCADMAISPPEARNTGI